MNTLGVALAAWSATCLAVLADNQQTINPKYLQRGEARKFAIEYVGKVVDIPAGTKKVRVWMPVPRDSTVQKIERLDFAPKASVTMENEYGNGIAFWEVENPPSSLERTMKVD